MTIEAIENNGLYKKVLAESFGGIMYNVADRNKYSQEQVNTLLTLWDNLPEAQKSVAGGIMKGAIGFLKGE